MNTNTYLVYISLFLLAIFGPIICIVVPRDSTGSMWSTTCMFVTKQQQQKGFVRAKKKNVPSGPNPALLKFFRGYRYEYIVYVHVPPRPARAQRQDRACMPACMRNGHPPTPGKEKMIRIEGDKTFIYHSPRAASVFFSSSFSSSFSSFYFIFSLSFSFSLAYVTRD